MLPDAHYNYPDRTMLCLWSKNALNVASAHILEDSKQDLVAQVGHTDINIITLAVAVLLC